MCTIDLFVNPDLTACLCARSFKTYAERWELKPAGAAGRPHHLLAVLPYCEELPLGHTEGGLVQVRHDPS